MPAADPLAFWTELLRLDGFCVAHVRQDAPSDPVRLTLVPERPLGLCPQCQRASDLIHRRHDSAPVKDLPVGPQAVELIIRSYQFACRHCGGFFTPAPPAFVPGAHATERFLARAVFGAGIPVTIDRFHGIKNFQERLTAARREVQRQFPREEAQAAQAPKGTRWLC